jgi:pyruvate,water dikinase
MRSAMELEDGRATEDRSAPLVVPLGSLTRDSVEVAGGKAANLGELTRAGFPVPDGFCLTTAAYAFVAGGVAEEVGRLDRARDERTRLESARRIRDLLVTAKIPEPVVAALRDAYETFGDGDGGRVAVRSSATAEDLAEASFAGQLETYLNISGLPALLDAVRRCWSSLWTDRAVSYRAATDVDQRAVTMAVVVQRMVDASVAGVLFTADPVSGSRERAAIDAAPGLGEAVVSGRANPDHFEVDKSSGRVERRAEGTERTLDDDEIRALTDLGKRVEASYGEPQDIEFALDAERRIWLTQTRSITSLYPLPAGAPAPPALRVYFSVNVAQGFLAPFTPMGLQGMRLVGTAISGVIRRPPSDPLAGPDFFAVAGERLFFDVTPILRDPLGRRLFVGAMSQMETRSSIAIRELLEKEPRLSLTARSRRRSIFKLLRWLAHARIPPRILYALLSPTRARRRAARIVARAVKSGDISPDATIEQRLDAFERLFRNGVAQVAPNVLPLAAAGAAAYAFATQLLGDLATNEERQIIRRALPNNPTMEMDLALWALSRRVRAGDEVRAVLNESPPERLAELYRRGALPPAFQSALADFLSSYGFRSVGEIDLGVPRWADDPTHVLGVLVNYARQPNDERAPDVQFRRARDEAEAMVKELSRRARSRSRVRGVLVGIALRRTRALFGLREVPKASFVRLLTRAREVMRTVGEQLVASGSIDDAEDVFFLTLTDLRSRGARADFRALVRERRQTYRRELRRRHVPRLLLSDGREPTAARTDEPLLRGTPASPGTATAAARILRTPSGAELEAGEILVAPSTDPGWTPLFLTAGGLVMEMGGAMSHGAIVAREYGIPAVVGVADATERITTGERITVDGSAGEVHLAPRDSAQAEGELSAALR